MEVASSESLLSQEPLERLPERTEQLKFHNSNDVNHDIRDNESFFREFGKYLKGRGELLTEDVIDVISSFAKFNDRFNPNSFLVRLGNIFQLHSDHVVHLPSLFNGWLNSFEDKERQTRAHIVYNDLLDFLEDRLVVHRGRHPCPYPLYSEGHISEEESVSRQQHLKALEQLVLANHPTKFWANSRLLHESK